MNLLYLFWYPLMLFTADVQYGTLHCTYVKEKTESVFVFPHPLGGTYFVYSDFLTLLNALSHQLYGKVRNYAFPVHFSLVLTNFNIYSYFLNRESITDFDPGYLYPSDRHCSVALSRFPVTFNSFLDFRLWSTVYGPRSKSPLFLIYGLYDSVDLWDLLYAMGTFINSEDLTFGHMGSSAFFNQAHSCLLLAYYLSKQSIYYHDLLQHFSH